jgi:inorganic pyrophosphatase
MEQNMINTEKAINVDKVVEVFIEISKNSNIKYEYEKERQVLICDRVLHTPFSYPFNYGFIEDTLSEDKDPIDVVVVTNHSIAPCCYIKCKIIGCLETEDDAGNDPKLIVRPIDKVDPYGANINNYTDLNQFTLDQIKYFFSHYKDLENKKVIVKEFVDAEEAIKIYHSSIERFENKV